jgi:tRNA U34 5-carboxymethylaminomethyl modifying enzyme MnmG/GidA
MIFKILIFINNNFHTATFSVKCEISNNFSGNGTKVSGKTVILTTGTFLKGQICIGLDTRPAGRIGDAPAVGLANTLESLNFRMGRLKTGI